MKAGAIIQARVGSTRLPGKVLMEVNHRPILAYVLERVSRAREIDRLILATTGQKQDAPIVDLAKKLNWQVYCGSENDVLDRYFQAARLFDLKHIVRISADCPLIDPQVIDRVLSCYFQSGADYCSNTMEVTFPDGLDTEVFSFAVLQDAWKRAGLASEREHVTPYIKNHPDRYKLVSFKNKVDLSQKRWTLDQGEDFEFIKAVLEALYPADPGFSMNDVLEFLRLNPQAEELNRGIIRNAGYLKSLSEDRKIK